MTTTVTLRPNATVTNNTWTIVPSGTADAVTSDTNNTTYLQSVATSNYATFDIGALTTLPAGGVITGVRVRVTGTDSAGNGLTVYLTEQPSGTGSYAQILALPTVMGSVVASSQWATRADGIRWQTADINNLQVTVQAASAGTFQVAEIFVDVFYNSQPNTPTGIVGSNLGSQQPTISWVYSDPDADAQAKYNVIVYTQAQTVAVGFIPGVTASTVNSGTVSSSATSWQITSLLTAGNYVAYVRTADSILKQDGSGTFTDHFSGFGSGAFTVTADLPAAPVVVSATPDSANNRVAVLLQGADNELTRQQASVESGQTGWYGASNATVFRDTTQFLNGISSLRVRATAGGTALARNTIGTSLAGLIAEGTAVLPNVQYTALASVHGTVGSRTALIRIDWYTAAGAFISTSTGSTVVPPTGVGAWTQMSLTATSPGTAAWCFLILNYSAAGAAEDVYFDQISLAPGVSTTWTRGGFVNNQNGQVDTFTRADSAVSLGTDETPVGPLAWAADNGTWGIQSNRAYIATPSATSSGVNMASLNLAQLDGVYTVDVTLSSARAAAGMALRVIGATSCITILLNKDASGDALAVGKLISGAGTPFTGSPVTGLGLVLGQTYGLKAELFGSGLKVYLDRKDGNGYILLLSTTVDAAGLVSLTSATKAGMVVFYAAAGTTSDDGTSKFDNWVSTQNPTQALIVERSVDGGTTWATVRTINKVGLTDPGQTGSFFDYEAPRGVSVRYRAKSQGTEFGVTVTSPVSPVVVMSPNLLGDGNSWLKSPTDPTKNMVLGLTAGLDSESSEDMVVYEPLGRADPIIHGGTIRTEGFDALAIYLDNDAAWAQFEVLRRRQEPLLLQTCFGDANGPEEYWVRLGPKRSVHRYTSDDMNTKQHRMVKIPARQVLSPTIL